MSKTWVLENYVDNDRGVLKVVQLQSWDIPDKLHLAVPYLAARLEEVPLEYREEVDFIVNGEADRLEVGYRRPRTQEEEEADLAAEQIKIAKNDRAEMIRLEYRLARLKEKYGLGEDGSSKPALSDGVN